MGKWIIFISSLVASALAWFAISFYAIGFVIDSYLVSDWGWLSRALLLVFQAPTFLIFVGVIQAAVERKLRG